MTPVAFTRFSRLLSLRPRRLTAGALSLLLAAPLTLGLGVARAENPELTVYNQNFALVKDYRPIALKAGLNDVTMDNVAALMDATSVHFKSLTAPQAVRVREQNFRYDLISRQNILDRMVGHKIRFTKEGKVREGILLNPATTVFRNGGYNGGSVGTGSSDAFAIQTPEGVLLTDLNEILIDTLPEGLYARPTLLWSLDSDKGGTHQSEVSYLTDGINWLCDYVAVLSDDDNHLDLTGWVTLDNQSGANYQNARLKLVAGDVRRVSPQAVPAYAGAVRQMMKMEAADAQPFQQEAFFEYHLYTLNARTSVMNRETKQVTLASAAAIPIRKKYIYDPDAARYRGWSNNGWADGDYGSVGYYGRPGRGWDSAESKKINTLIQFKNSQENHLGMPLPKGRIRVNKADSSGSIQFVGEDRIDHTAVNEEIELYLGDAFDLVGEKKRITFHEETHAIEETYEVKIRNHKKTSATIHVVDHLFGDWTIRANSAPFTKTDAHTVDFALPVPPDGERVLTYTVRVRR
ncbi:MAG: hypothetical protein IPK79_06655 [Vampirovibrionales bacterium]|nr:hypothetical protein [Vampirovibrionales bacterium]